MQNEKRTRPSDPEELSLSRASKLYGRALRLRCPACGEGSLAGKWLLRRPERCSACGMRANRGEEDFFLGAMMFNLVLSEGLLAVVMVLAIVVMWPNVPWEPLWYTGMVLMLLAPVFFYPLSHTIWLASDILIRPVTEDEMEWHRNNGATAYRPQEHR